jgi:transposase
VKTVRRLVRGPKARARRESKLDAFRPLIEALVVTHRLSAVLVIQELRAQGYTGGYSILKDYVRRIRPRGTHRPHLRFETAPGEQGQVDLSPYTVSIADVRTDVVCFSLVFGYSRWQFLRFFRHADVHAVCHAHVLGFTAAGGVPREILYDRMKQVVLESHRHTVVFHPLFAAMRDHYGYRAVPLAPGYPEGKGKVENPFRYVEGNFLPRRRFRDLDDLNQQADAWLRDTAHVRVHGTTRERPRDRLEHERPLLIPLPPQAFEAAQIEERLVGDDFCVAWETNRYSVPPHFAGHDSKARVVEGVLEVFIPGIKDPITRHRLSDGRHQRVILPEHEAEFRATSTSRHVLGTQFVRLGPAAKGFADGLVAENRGAAGYHMSRILTLADEVGVPAVAEALRHALRYGAFDYHAVARIVRGKTYRPIAVPPAPAPIPTHITEYLRGAGEHQRPLQHYHERLAPPPAPDEDQEPPDGK